MIVIRLWPSSFTEKTGVHNINREINWKAVGVAGLLFENRLLHLLYQKLSGHWILDWESQINFGEQARWLCGNNEAIMAPKS